jgi:hypothetical protein
MLYTQDVENGVGKVMDSSHPIVAEHLHRPSCTLSNISPQPPAQLQSAINVVATPYISMGGMLKDTVRNDGRDFLDPPSLLDLT